MWIVRGDLWFEGMFVFQKAFWRNVCRLPCPYVVRELVPETAPYLLTKLTPRRINDTSTLPIQPLTDRRRIYMHWIGEEPPLAD